MSSLTAGTTSTNTLDSDDVELLRIVIPYKPRNCPNPTTPSTNYYYRLYYSLDFCPPRDQGRAGDFFVKCGQVFYKSKGPWVVAHFTKRTPHPTITNLLLGYNLSGPCWSLHSLSDIIGPGDGQWASAHVSFRFYKSSGLLDGLPGSSPNSPIHILD